MNDQNESFDPVIGSLEGSLSTAHIIITEIPTREVENEYGIELHIGEEVADNV